MGEIQKQRVGRPTKYRPEFVEQAEQLCRDEGYTDEQLAAKLGIGRTQLYFWKREYPDFAEAIKRGKEALSSVLRAMSMMKS